MTKELNQIILFFFIAWLSASHLEAREATTPLDLRHNIDQIIATAKQCPEKLSVKIVRLSDAKTLYQHEADEPLNPASNMKLVTIAAALRRLGPDFTFKTDFYTTTSSNGALQNLWSKGHGDPLLITEELPRLVASFRAAGIRSIRGAVYVDDSFFDHHSLISDVSNRGSSEYTILTSPLAFNFNGLEVQVEPAHKVGLPPVVTLSPANYFITVVNQAKTGGGRRATVHAHLDANHQLIITGSVPPSRGTTLRIDVPQPSGYAAGAIIAALQEAGIRFDGRILSGLVPSEATKIFTHESPPLSEVIKSMGKFSNNFTAEQLLKTLGAVLLGSPGSTEAGVRVLQSYFGDLKIPPQSYVLANGSGLSRETRVTASQLVTLLEDMYHSPLRDSFISSLSISGIDGTIRHRLRNGDLRGKIAAKTGSLNGVVTLSGYWFSNTARPVAFSILMNGPGVSLGRVASLQEKILTAVDESLEQN